MSGFCISQDSNPTLPGESLIRSSNTTCCWSFYRLTWQTEVFLPESLRSNFSLFLHKLQSYYITATWLASGSDGPVVCRKDKNTWISPQIPKRRPRIRNKTCRYITSCIIGLSFAPFRKPVFIFQTYSLGANSGPTNRVSRSETQRRCLPGWNLRWMVITGEGSELDVDGPRVINES